MLHLCHRFRSINTYIDLLKIGLSHGVHPLYSMGLLPSARDSRLRHPREPEHAPTRARHPAPANPRARMAAQTPRGPHAAHIRRIATAVTREGAWTKSRYNTVQRVKRMERVRVFEPVPSGRAHSSAHKSSPSALRGTIRIGSKRSL